MVAFIDYSKIPIWCSICGVTLHLVGRDAIAGELATVSPNKTNTRGVCYTWNLAKAIYCQGCYLCCPEDFE